MFDNISETVLDIKVGLDRLNEDFFKSIIEKSIHPLFEKIEEKNKSYEGVL